MNSSMLWMGLLPIAGFVILDSFTQKKTALFGAVGLGAAELLFSLIQFGKLDYLSILSLFILILFVYLSLKLKNDFYFKIQSGVVNSFLSCVILAADFFFDKNLLLDMTQKYIGFDKIINMNAGLNESILVSFLTQLNLALPWWILAHSAFVIYSAYKWNKWLWFSIRVPGFYLMLVLMGSTLRPF